MCTCEHDLEDEIARDIAIKNWENLQVYLITFAEQERSFSLLIDGMDITTTHLCKRVFVQFLNFDYCHAGLFPSADRVDTAARDALSFYARRTFILLDNLREYAKAENVEAAEKTYARLLLSYDRFLKAGDLYPTYDPISSTAVFFRDNTQDQLRYNKKEKPVQRDRILLISGPDMVLQLM